MVVNAGGIADVSNLRCFPDVFLSFILLCISRSLSSRVHAECRGSGNISLCLGGRPRDSGDT